MAICTNSSPGMLWRFDLVARSFLAQPELMLVQVAERGFRVQSLVIVTTLVDHKTYPGGGVGDALSQAVAGGA